ncbi:hypothetical protein F5148DRAFT_1375778 [Russula earlei]|uniref:Uncharacterized protein n=1 Tax=Russula earlei TaxID=71964 RepID=A0ACC0UAM6_9AGAM|nr:hypothetical protein F5148DRAFT_1375778 [Russula earlei]
MGEARNIPLRSPSSKFTATAKAAQARVSLRSPLVNPYDRFTQPEFDAWIGDITSALKRALDPEIEPDVDSPSRHRSTWNTVPDSIGEGFSAEGWAQSPASSGARDEEESTFDDSLSRIASRRAKGKARDPREGPGLGLKGQPIELLSDSEEEEVVDSLEVDTGFSEDADDSARGGSSGETDHAESELDEDTEASPGRPGTSAQHIVEFMSVDDNVQLSGSTGALHDGDGNDVFTVLGNKVGADDGFPVPSQIAAPFDVELADPWDGPRTYAEDYFSGGDRLAPGLTPNHLTPVVLTPPILTSTSHVALKTEAQELFPFPRNLHLIPSSKQPDSANDNVVDELPPFGRAVAPFVNDQQVNHEPSDGLYHDNVKAAGANNHAFEDVETEAGGSTEVISSTKTKLVNREPSASYPTRSNPGVQDRGAGQEHEIIWVPLSDDDTDSDGEEDDGKFLGALPLGTSDLDIRDGWHAAGRREDLDFTSEEDELQEIASSQTADGVTKTASIALSQLPEAENRDVLHAPLVDPQVTLLASTFQFIDADSFGDLPLSSPPSGTPSPASSQPTAAFELPKHSIEQFIVDFEKEATEKRGQASGPSSSLARQSETETANTWASRELENILSGEISIPDDAPRVSGPASTGRSTSPEAAAFSADYIVEGGKLPTKVLLDDDFGDTCSVSPPDLNGVIEMIRPYEVEEPSNGPLTEEPEITIEISGNDDTTTSRQIISSIESTATSIISEQNLHPVSPKGGLSCAIGLPASEAFRADASLTIPNIPAPIIADPSVPDPVLRDSSPSTPAFTDPPYASAFFMIPPAILRMNDFQTNSQTSGLFTPAQRSEGGTSVQLEDEMAEALTDSHNGADKRLTTASINLQAKNDPPSIERLVTHREHGVDVEHRDVASVDEIIKSSTDHHLGAGSVDVNEQDGVSVSSESLSGTTSLVKDDEHADGESEAGPNYSHGHGANANSAHQNCTHRPAEERSEVFPGTANDDTHPHIIGPQLESLPMGASSQKQESEAVRKPSSAPIADAATLQGTPFAESGEAENKRNLTVVVQSEVNTRNGREHPTQAPRRKRRDPNPGPTRITRSKSGFGVTRRRRDSGSSSRRWSAPSKKAQSEVVDANIDADSVNDGASENASVSSGTSAVYRLLRGTSRAGSVVSSLSGDAPSPPTSGVGRMVPLIHSHGFHHHNWPVPPSLVSPTPSTDPHKGTRSGQTKAKSPTPTLEPSTPSLNRASNTNSPVTRSNCRFHKVSLPQGEDGARALFVVPGCALGDGGLMDGEDIRDEGFSSHEDHKRMLPNVETLDLSPYLVGVLRQLVGVDLLREQQEIFYLPREEEKPRKRHQTGALESLRQFRPQSISSGGPHAREHSPRPSEISQGRATPPRSAWSAVSGSVREESVVHSEDGDSTALSDADNDDDLQAAPPAKRLKSSAGEMGPPENTLPAGELGDSTVPEHPPPEEESTVSSRPPTARRSKRKPLKYDAAAYKPSEDDEKDDEPVEGRKRRRSSARKTTKRSRTMDDASAGAPRTKKPRLGRAISVAGAGAAGS